MRRYALLTTFAIVAGGLASQASAQRVVRQSNGDLNVEFSGPCTVHYNRNLTLESVDRSCTSYQRMLADQAIAPYRGGAYPGYPGSGHTYFDPQYPGVKRQYRITDIRYDRVQFADVCRVYYNWMGQHLRSKGGCNIQQRSIADRAMADWRRHSGYYPGGGGYNPGGSWNDIQLLPSYDGGLHVRFTNKCDVYYSARGYRIRADNICSRNQVARADQAARYYRPGIRY